jgi:hypothetical protein
MIGNRLVDRFLVNHGTGIGKTRSMIEMLHDSFRWQMAKVVIVPKQPVVTNFLFEIVQWPSHWRDFWATLHPIDANLSAGGVWTARRGMKWRPDRLSMDARSALRDALALKGGLRNGRFSQRYNTCGNFRDKHPDLLLPGGPLRIMNYARAGGRAMALDTLDPVLKFGIEHISGASYPTSLTPWSGKLVMLDEAHNLTTPCKRFEEALTALREALLTLSPASILVALRATADRALVDIVKGVRADRLNDEGFLSFRVITKAAIDLQKLSRWMELRL